MKLPSLLRVPKPRSFEYQPRYYDPQKEEREERFKRILREAEAKKDESFYADKEAYKGHIAKAFEQGRKQQQGAQVGRTQIVLMLLLVLTVVAYWYLGSKGLWLLLGGVLAVYFWLRRQSSNTPSRRQRRF
jgi:Flp pilus assembly protein TadB